MSNIALKATKASSFLKQRKDLIFSESQTLLSKRILIFTQANNLDAKELEDLRTNLAKSKVSLKFLKTSIFRSALKGSPHHPHLSEVISGPVMALTSNSEPGEIGPALLATLKSKPNIHVLAGKIDDQLWTHEGCSQVLQSIPKRLEIMSQLMGLIQTPPVALVNTISLVPNSLASILDLKSKSQTE